MAADTDARSSSRESKGADPMAEHKRRARWRLLGVLIIASAVAAVAPVLLEEQARPLSQDLIIDIPSKTSAFSKIDAPKPAPKAEPATKAEPVSKAEPVAKTEPVANAEPPAKVAPAVKAEPITKAEPAVKAEPKSLAKGFMVQVGAYAKIESANAVKTRLESGGHKVVVESIKLADGTDRHRVRIGPFETREQANEVRDRAKTQGYDAAVITP